MSNVAEELSREIARVTKIRMMYAAIDGLPHANVKPALFLMDQSLEAEKKTAGLDGAVERIKALVDLRRFEA